ncbi:MAG: Hsp20/alpha crystallin family protein [Anaerolineales bacterium]|nr:Hsp20/alpha crystallin family protein [Anaerolineales bacterium]
MADMHEKTAAPRPVIFLADDFQHPLQEGSRWRVISRPHIWRPPTDVYETDDAYIIRVEIAGMREQDFQIALTERGLLIRGIRQDTPERRAYYQMEIPFGEFNTEIELPYPIVADQVEAVYKDGFLRMQCPKARPQQIKVDR